MCPREQKAVKKGDDAGVGALGDEEQTKLLVSFPHLSQKDQSQKSGLIEKAFN